MRRPAQMRRPMRMRPRGASRRSEKPSTPRNPRDQIAKLLGLLTIGCLLAAEPGWPRALAVIPVAWAIVAGSAALLLGVRADLMLWVAAIALTAHALAPPRSRR